MENLPMIINIEPKTNGNMGVLIKTTTKNIDYFCRDIQLAGDFMILNEAKQTHFVESNNDVEYDNRRHVYKRCFKSHARDVTQIMIKQNEAMKTTTVSKNEINELPDWVMRTKEVAIEMANKKQIEHNEKVKKENEQYRAEIIKFAADSHRRDTADKEFYKSFWRRKFRSNSRCNWISQYLEDAVIDTKKVEEEKGKNYDRVMAENMEKDLTKGF